MITVKRSIINIALLVLVPAVFWACATALMQSERGRPNVILITAHSLRNDHLSCCGYTRIATPALDDLSKKGFLFENAYCNVPVPAHGYGSILTGRMGSTAVVTKGDFIALDDPVRTLPEYLRTGGYTTAVIAANAALLPAMDPAAKGFDISENIMPGLPKKDRASRDSITTGRALGAIKTLMKKKRPIFAWISYSIPRYPYDLPQDFEKAKDDFPYDRQVLLLDGEVSRLIDGLAKLELINNTLIIFTSASGESLGEHREPETGVFLYDATVKVPLIIKPPGASSGTRVYALSSQADIVPTVLDILKIQHNTASFDGAHITTRATDKDRHRRAVYLESLHGYAMFGWSPLEAIVSGDYKYIEAPTPELYDLSKDPHELKNIAGLDGKRAAQMKIKLMEFIKVRRPRLLEILDKGADPKDKIDVLAPYLLINRFHGDYNANFLIGMYERLLDKDPKNRAFRYTLARLYLRQGKPYSAEKYLLSLNEDYPSSGRAWELLGEVYNQLNKKDDAIVCYEKAVAIRPDSPVALNNLAWHYAQIDKDFARALQYAERANELAGNNPSFLDTLAEVRYRMGEAGRAAELLRKALSLDPESEYLQSRLKGMEGGQAKSSRP